MCCIIAVIIAFLWLKIFCLILPPKTMPEGWKCWFMNPNNLFTILVPQVPDCPLGKGATCLLDRRSCSPNLRDNASGSCVTWDGASQAWRIRQIEFEMVTWGDLRNFCLVYHILLKSLITLMKGVGDFSRHVHRVELFYLLAIPKKQLWMRNFPYIQSHFHILLATSNYLSSSSKQDQPISFLHKSWWNVILKLVIRRLTHPLSIH